jgi:hypothetical protein
MSLSPLPRGNSRFGLLSIIRFLAAMVVLFAVENIWVDSWLRNKSRHIPSLVPEPMSGLWFLALLVVVIICVLMVVAQTLVSLDRGTPLLKRVGTGFVAFLAVLMCVLWVLVTSGMSSVPSWLHASKGHSVTLTWKASKSAVAGYNVYRSTKPGGPYKRINSHLVRDLTYRDEDIQSGMTYYYAARAVDAKGVESSDSNETSATIP